MSALYFFEESRYRGGKVQGLFVAKKTDADQVNYKTINFGEILGKHSEVEVDIRLRELSDDPKVIECVENLFKEAGVDYFGYNPLASLDSDDESDEDASEFEKDASESEKDASEFEKDASESDEDASESDEDASESDKLQLKRKADEHDREESSKKQKTEE